MVDEIRVETFPTLPGEEFYFSSKKKKKDDDPCWKGYIQVGMKKNKKGQMVPNCVPNPKGKIKKMDPKKK